MRTLRNKDISRSAHRFLVAFSSRSDFLPAAVRKTVVVCAQTPGQARRICRLRYPNARFLQVFVDPSGNGQAFGMSVPELAT